MKAREKGREPDQRDTRKMIYCRFLHCNFGNLPSTKRHLPNLYCEPVTLLLYCRKSQNNRRKLVWDRQILLRKNI